MPNASISASRLAATVFVALLSTGAAPLSAAIVPVSFHVSERADESPAGALETRRPAPAAEAPAVNGLEGFDGGLAAPPWESGAAGREGEDRPTPGLGLNGAAPADALPLSKLGREPLEPRTPTSEAQRKVLGFLKHARSGGLPEPASWALILIGFAMIGGAVRGFIVANRNLAKLQPEESD